MEHLLNAIGMVLSAVVMVGLYKLFPPRLQDYGLPPGTDLQALGKKYSKFEIGLNLLMLVALAAGTAIAFWVFRAVGELSTQYRGESEFMLTPLWFVWFFPAFPAGIFLAVLVVEPISNRILGDRQREYLAVQETRYGRLARLSTRPIYAMCFLPSLAIAYLFVDTYVIFRKDEIVIDPLTRLRARHYEYASVERIVVAPRSVAPNGQAHVEWRFVLHFSDGDRWNSRWDPSGSSEAVHGQIAEFVSQQSGIGIETVEVLQRADQ